MECHCGLSFPVADDVQRYRREGADRLVGLRHNTVNPNGSVRVVSDSLRQIEGRQQVAQNGPDNEKDAAFCVTSKNPFRLPALAPVAPSSITIAPSVKVPLRTITPHRSRAHPGFDTPVSAIQPPPLADLRSPENCPGASWPPTLDGVASTNPHSLRKDKPSELTTTEQARLDFVSSLQQTDPIHTRNWPAATR